MVARGRTPLTSGRGYSHLTRATSWTFGGHVVRKWPCARTPSWTLRQERLTLQSLTRVSASFRCHPGCRSHFVANARSFLGRCGLFDVAIQCRACPRNVQISSHEVSTCTKGQKEQAEWQIQSITRTDLACFPM